MIQALLSSENVQFVAVLGTLLGALITGLVSYIIAKMHSRTDIQKFYENKIAELLATQSREIHALKMENERLTKEVRTLTQQIIDLKNEQIRQHTQPQISQPE